MDDAPSMTSVETALRRMRAAAERVATLDPPYPLEPPRFAAGCSPAEIDELLGDAASRVRPYAEFLSRCRSVDAADVFNGYFLFSPIDVIRQAHAPRRVLIGQEPFLAEVEVLAVGGDGGGNLFVMGTSVNAPGRVWKWNHEHPARADGTAIDAVTEVAADFVSFLERIALDWEHFVANDAEWRNISG